MSTEIYTKCPVCGEDVIQGPELKESKCSQCGKIHVSNYSCKNGHKFCNSCLISKYADIAKEICLNSESRDPVEIAEKIMSHQEFTLIGCKHYMVAPIALYTAFKNCGGKVVNFEESLSKIIDASTHGQVSMCKIGGVCGIPLSLGRTMYASNPDNTDSMEAIEISNRSAYACMKEMMNPEYKGSRDCCKRNVYLTIFMGVKDIRNNFWVNLDLPGSAKCKFSKNNPRCNKELCQMYKGRTLSRYY